MEKKLYWPTKDWKVSTAKDVGMNYLKLNEIDSYIRAKRCSRLYSVLVVKNGHIVLEKYYNGFNSSKKNVIMSIIKSIMSILIGIACDQGLIRSLDDRFSSYFPEYFKSDTDPVKRQITIQNILTMTSGLYWVSGVHNNQPLARRIAMSKDWVESILNLPQKDKPGTQFQYKEIEFILLSALIAKISGMNAYEFAKKHLLDPLGVESPPWKINCKNIAHNYVWIGDQAEDNLKLSARDLTKIGYLYLNNGQWEERTIVSREYIQASLLPNTSENFTSYGFMWWLENGNFKASGWGGQTVAVLPAYDLIVVIQGNHEVGRGEGFDSLIDDIVIPAIIT